MDIEEYLGTACNSTPSIENHYFRVGHPHEPGTFVFVTKLPGSTFLRGIRHRRFCVCISEIAAPAAFG